MVPAYLFNVQEFTYTIEVAEGTVVVGRLSGVGGVITRQLAILRWKEEKAKLSAPVPVGENFLFLCVTRSSL